MGIPHRYQPGLRSKADSTPAHDRHRVRSGRGGHAHASHRLSAGFPARNYHCRRSGRRRSWRAFHCRLVGFNAELRSTSQVRSLSRPRHDRIEPFLADHFGGCHLRGDRADSHSQEASVSRKALIASPGSVRTKSPASGRAEDSASLKSRNTDRGSAAPLRRSKPRYPLPVFQRDPVR